MDKEAMKRLVLRKKSGLQASGKAVNFSRMPNSRLLLQLIKHQVPAILAMVIVGYILFIWGFASGAFSLIAVVFLIAVIYTAITHGIRQGLLSAGIVVLFNAYGLLPYVERYSLADSNMRRIVLLAVVIPTLAYIVGRLHDRNEHLLKHEQKARRKAEENEERIRFMAVSMPQKVFTNEPDGKLIYSNPQWAEYTGMPSEKITGKGWVKFVHPGDVKENIIRWEHSMKTGEPFTYEHRLKRRDGRYRWHITRSQAMRDDSGEILMWVGSSTDIHDIKTALERERKLVRTAARLAEQRKQLLILNKAKDEFISLASHQLRTPATGAKQYLGMVLEGFAGDITKEQRKFLQKAYESNERQITIVNDLLKVASVDAGKVRLQKGKTDLVTLLQSIIDEQKSKFAERSQEVNFQSKRAHLMASVDKSNLRMVLENILDNASKYTPKGKLITVGLKKSKNTVVISVKDEGVGIGPKDIERIFHKFSRIDNPLSVAVGGSGLGLYWAKKIIDLHGGSINIKTRVGKGSTFTISIPLK